MFFCPKCSYSLDLKKSAIVGNKSVVVSTNKVEVKSVSAGITQVIKNDIDPAEIKPKFTKDQMVKNKNYGKLSFEDKNKMLEVFNQHGGAHGVMFLCNNCGWVKDINDTIKLYSYQAVENTQQITPNEYFILFNNPILSRTKDYSCKNKSCETHKKPDKKEAVFFHSDKSLEVKYICGSCYNSWTI